MSSSRGFPEVSEYDAFLRNSPDLDWTRIAAEVSFCKISEYNPNGIPRYPLILALIGPREHVKSGGSVNFGQRETPNLGLPKKRTIYGLLSINFKGGQLIGYMSLAC